LQIQAHYLHRMMQGKPIAGVEVGANEGQFRYDFSS
jgi:hypothetical protein